MWQGYNYQAFTPEEVKQGLFQDLLDYLMGYNKKNRERYYDIHITTDGYCWVIEWVEVNYNEQYGQDGKFEYIPADSCVMTAYRFPDGHSEYFATKAEFEEVLEDWLKENPGWVKNEYGLWSKI